MLFKDICICMKCVRVYMYKGIYVIYCIFFCCGVNYSEVDIILVEFIYFLCVFFVIKYSIFGG